MNPIVSFTGKELLGQMVEKQEVVVVVTKDEMMMMRIILLIFALSVIVFNSQAQTDTVQYKKNKLKKTEVDLLMSYYSQDGNHSAVTGGIGTQKLTDLSTNIEVNLLYDGKKKGNENNFGLNFGIDSYTSASSDNIDPATISGASAGDVRVYPTLSYSHKNDSRSYSLGANVSFSTEYDYQSLGLGMSFAKSSKDRNREVSVSWQSYLDTWSIIYPIELRPPGYPTGAEDDGALDTEARNSHSFSVVYSQVINKRMQASILADGIYQNGLLSTPFHRTVLGDETLVEKLPDTRFKLPIGIRLNSFISDFLVSRMYYRYYWDDWGISAHTASIELPIEVKQWLSISPIYRFHHQKAMNYFYVPETEYTGQEYYSNDYDLSAFHSHFTGIGVRVAPASGIINWKKGKYSLPEINIRYGYYSRSDGLSSNIISFHLKFVNIPGF